MRILYFYFSITMLWIISLRLLFMFWLCIKALLAIWKRIFWKRIDLFPFSFLKISPHPSAGGQSTKMVNWVREKEKQPLTFRSKAWVLLQAGLAVIDCIKHKHFHRTSTSNQAPLWLWWIKTKKKKKKDPSQIMTEHREMVNTVQVTKNGYTLPCTGW